MIIKYGQHSANVRDGETYTINCYNTKRTLFGSRERESVAGWIRLTNKNGDILIETGTGEIT
jgi:hypothetical protein